MPRMIAEPLATNQFCKGCGRTSMETKMLDAVSGRTIFLADSCMECGYLHSYTFTVPRPLWNWIAFVLVALAGIGAGIWLLI